ncbi:MAG TPA: hypothetical protein QGI59_05170, partial [Candidatus Poseidoniia archaeon]|nr:hypothetical protein [Candidatus Poseidoniia archaeon]
NPKSTYVSVSGLEDKGKGSGLLRIIPPISHINCGPDISGSDKLVSDVRKLRPWESQIGFTLLPRLYAIALQAIRYEEHV